MFIYRISQTTNERNFGVFFGAIVVAPNEEYARNMFPGGNSYSWTPLQRKRMWVPPEEVIVESIGTAVASFTEPTILCADFAG